MRAESKKKKAADIPWRWRPPCQGQKCKSWWCPAHFSQLKPDGPNGSLPLDMSFWIWHVQPAGWTLDSGSGQHSNTEWKGTSVFTSTVITIINEHSNWLIAPSSVQSPNRTLRCYLFNAWRHGSWAVRGKVRCNKREFGEALLSYWVVSFISHDLFFGIVKTNQFFTDLRRQLLLAGNGRKTKTKNPLRARRLCSEGHDLPCHRSSEGATADPRLCSTPWLRMSVSVSGSRRKLTSLLCPRRPWITAPTGGQRENWWIPLLAILSPTIPSVRQFQLQ